MAVGIVITPIFVTALACGRDTMPPAPSPVQSLPKPVPPVTSLPQEEKQSPASYQSRGRRDPFRPPRAMTAEKPPTVHLNLTGIVREAHSYYALVESDSSPGMGYIIHENDVVDSAKVVKITKDSVVFEVHTKNSEGKLLTRYVEKHMLSVQSR
ncbi:MAG: hypothetical protein KGL31_09400 [candidate division NC10 bacterium]|nr:hypothetical protein [candidate division NC10 bacterium]MDE2322114.1 hypothetical protein [candidate division NC10 bacterium]